MDALPIESKLIFLAEDDVDDLMLFTEALDDIGLQNKLIVSKDGVELMKNLDTKVPPAPRAIFLDLNMPRKNGFECLREIRDDDKLKALPVIILSTSGNSTAVDTTYVLGATAFLRKPPSFALLKKMIETILASDLEGKRSKEEFFLKVE